MGSILTNSELQWLQGKKKVSKAYEYRIRSDIRKKLDILKSVELPLLQSYGFLDELSVFTQKLSDSPQLEDNNIAYNNSTSQYISYNPHHSVLNSPLEQTNTYNNNTIDKSEGAGGLAWLGYRLDMAGIVGSNPTRPI